MKSSRIAGIVVVTLLAILVGAALRRHESPKVRLVAVHTSQPSSGKRIISVADLDVPATGQPIAGVEPAHQLLARPESEWQGMLVDLTVQPYCESSDRCGLARACIAQACAPCAKDGDCTAGEGCVLDHCVPSSRIECHKAAECVEREGQGALCILSGYSYDPRGNQNMRALCLKPEGLSPLVGLDDSERSASAVRTEALPATDPAVLLESLRR